MAKARSGSSFNPNGAISFVVKVSTSRKRHHNEENNCHSRLRANCADGIRADEFHGKEARVTVTGTIITATEEGSAANYQPVKTLVIREDASNKPGRYVLNGPGRIVNKTGEVVQTAIKLGTRVRVYYSGTGDSRMVDHVVVLE